MCTYSCRGVVTHGGLGFSNHYVVFNSMFIKLYTKLEATTFKLVCNETNDIEVRYVTH